VTTTAQALRRPSDAAGSDASPARAAPARGGGPTRPGGPPVRLVQRLSVSTPTDPFEVEAGTAAQRIVAGQPVGAVSAAAGPARVAVGEDEEKVQRIAVGEDQEVIQRVPAGEDDEKVQRVAVGGGSVGAPAATALRNPVGGTSVPLAVRSVVEPRLGADLGGVRVHDDAAAHRTAAHLQARALTFGNHIFLGRGESPHDLPLMAHEVTHVVQQGAAFGLGGGPGPAVQAAGGEQVQRLPAFVTDTLAEYARYIPGYTLLTVIVGYDPLAGAAVERNAVNLVGGIMGLTPLGTVVFDKLNELGVLQDAFAFIEQQLATYGLSLGRIESLISEAWEEMDFVRLDPFDYNLGVLTRKLGGLVDDVAGFAAAVLGAVLDLIREAALDVVEPLLAENRAWSLIKKILRYDPLRDVPDEASTVEILEDFLILIGRETELAQMRERGALQETADWLDTQLGVFLGLLLQYRALFTAAWEAIQPENLTNLLPNLQALAGQAFSLLQQVWDFAGTVAAKVLELVKKALLGWLSDFALQVPGFHLLTVILGRNPFTGEDVPRTPTTIIRGFITLLPGGNATYDQLAESGVVGQAAASIEAAMAELGISWAMATELFLGIWNSLSIADLVDPVGAFVRIRDRFGETIARLFAFVMVVVREIFMLVLALMNFPTDVVVRIVTNAMAAWSAISQNPVGFILNLLGAVKEGFTRFFAGIFGHLLGGLLDWLFRGVRQAGIEPPSELSLEAGLEFVMQVLGITEENLWAKLAERIGQDRVDQIRGAIDKLTGIWTFVKDVQERGIVAIWEYIQGQITSLWDVVISTARNWIMEKIVIKVTMWLLSFLDPTFIMSVVNGFVFVFNAIASAVEYVREMLDIVDLFVGTVASIARGDIAPGAAMLEQGLVASIPVAIGFLAYQVGLGRIGDKIAEIVGGVHELVDKGLDWLMDQAERALNAVLGMLGMGEAEAADKATAPSPVDPKDHEAVATTVVATMQQAPKVTDYASVRVAKETQARDLETRYAALLEPGIKLSIAFAPPKQDAEDQDLDFEVTIAPNTTTKKSSVGIPEGPGLDLKVDEAVYIRLKPGAPEEPGRFVREQVLEGRAFYVFGVARFAQSGLLQFIPRGDTDSYRRRPERGHHTMDLAIVVGATEVVSETFVSGNMSQEEYELGWPLSMLATHTEARALDAHRSYIHPGAHWEMTGHYLSCNSCKGKLNAAARQGASLHYEPGNFTASA
jgi:hypothetical protein